MDDEAQQLEAIENQYSPDELREMWQKGSAVAAMVQHPGWKDVLDPEIHAAMNADMAAFISGQIKGNDDMIRVQASMQIRDRLFKTIEWYIKMGELAGKVLKDKT